MKTPKNPAQARAAAIKNHARTEGRSPAEVLAAYTTPQPPEHLRVHHLAAHMIPAPSPSNPLPPVPLVCPKGEAYVVLDHLAWNLDAGRPGVAELEAHAHAWAADLPAHHRALADLWVNGFPIAPRALPALAAAARLLAVVAGRGPARHQTAAATGCAGTGCRAGGARGARGCRSH